jgi:hypothetical protein
MSAFDADYLDYVTTAAQMIAEVGEACVWHQPGDTQGGMTPWKPTAGSASSAPVIVCWTPSLFRSVQWLDIDLTKDVEEGSMFGIVAGAQYLLGGVLNINGVLTPNPFVPSGRDMIQRSDNSYVQLEHTDPVGPDGRIIVHIIKGRRL